MIIINKDTLNNLVFRVYNANWIDIFNDNMPFTGYYLIEFINETNEVKKYLAIDINNASTADIESYIKFTFTEGTDITLDGTDHFLTLNLYWVDETLPIVEVTELPTVNHLIKTEYARLIGTNNIIDEVYI